MIALLARLFIHDNDQTGSPAVRSAYGVLCGAVGILLNILLFAGKLVAGTLSSSVAITADAFNNLSDAGSSLVTMIGFRLACQKPDPKHPFGHGRLEYVSGLIVSMLILLMGYELARSSFDKILHPETISLSVVSAVILAVSILVKLYMTFYNREVGKKIDSAAMRAVASDSFSDSIATAVVLAASIVGALTHLPLDGWCGVAVAVFIFRSGILSAMDTINPLLGETPDPAMVQQIKEIVLSYEKVASLHDLVVHSYGPGRCMISLHAEVPDTEDFREMHDLIDNIEQDLRARLGCEAVIHMDPIALNDPATVEIRKKLTEAVKTLDQSLTLHDFRMVIGKTHTNLIFDIVVPFGFPLSDDEVSEKVKELARQISEDYIVICKVDHAYVSSSSQT